MWRRGFPFGVDRAPLGKSFDKFMLTDFLLEKHVPASEA